MKEKKKAVKKRELYLEVSYIMNSNPDFVITDRRVVKAVGRIDIGSGAGMGYRDLTFLFHRDKAVNDAMRRVKKLRLKGCSVDICEYDFE